MQNIVTAFRQHPLWQSLKHRYAQLTVKEQRAILVLVGLLTVVILYLIIWAPLDQWADTQKQRYERQWAAHNWMQQHIEQAHTLAKKQRMGTSSDLATTVTGLAKKADITISKVQPAKQSLAVWLDDVAYQKLLAWLIDLETQYHIAVQQIRIDKLKEEGRVRVYTQLRA